MNAKRRSPTRAKWIFTILAAVLLALWIGSGWFRVSLAINETSEDGSRMRQVLDASAGCFRFRKDILGSTIPRVSVGDFYSGWRFLPGYERFGPLYWIDVPIWIPFAPLALLAAREWRRGIRWKRLVAANSCPSCGYDRRGLSTDALCPECGKK